MGAGGEGEIPLGYRNALTRLGDTSGNLVSEITNAPSFYDLPEASLRQRGARLGGGSAARTFGRGGVADFTRDDRRAFALTRGLSGSDAALGQAANIYRNNAGVQGLENFNVFDHRQDATRALQRFDPSATRNVNFNELRGVDFSGLQSLESNPAYNQLLATSRGDNLAVDNNPFLADALAASQRQTTDAFNKDVLPNLAAQFGGGFGLTGSAAKNAQIRAADDLTRNLSEQATQTYADQFSRERAAQDQASQFLGNLDLSRASTLGELDLSRGTNLGELGLSRAGAIDNAKLARAQSLGQLGAEFSGQELARNTNLGQLENDRAGGLSAVGQARRAQELQRINALNQIGQQQRGLDERLYQAHQQQVGGDIDERLRRYQQLSAILGQNAGVLGGGGGPSQTAGAIGGAATGAAAGSYFGPYGTAAGALIGGGLGYYGYG